MSDLPRYGQSGYGASLPPTGGGWAAPPPMPGGVPLRPLTVGDMFSGAFTLIRRNPVATLGLAAIVETLYAIVTTSLARSEQNLNRRLQLSLKGHPTSAQIGHDLSHFFSSFLPYLFVTIALAFIAQCILTGMLTGALGRGLIGNKITIGEAWRIARVPAVIGVSLLVVAIVLIPWLVLGLIVAGLVAAKITAAAIAVGVIGFICLFVVTIWASVRLFMAVPVVVLEVASPTVALRRSWQLVAGNWWRVFGIYLLAAIVVSVMAAIIEVPFGIARVLISGGGSMLSGLASTAKPTVLALIVSAIGGIIATTCTRPISAGISVLLYADLRMRKEGLDLVLQQAGQSPGMSGDEFTNIWQPGPRQAGFGPPGGPYIPPGTGPYIPPGGGPYDAPGGGPYNPPGGGPYNPPGGGPYNAPGGAPSGGPSDTPGW